MNSVWDEAQPLLAAIVRNPAFEAQHPRGRDGRFIFKGGWVKWIGDMSGGLWHRGQIKSIEDDGQVTVTQHHDGTDIKLSPKKLYSAAALKATIDPNKMKKIGGQAGSNAGGLYEDADSDKTKWYVKTPQSKQHAANESFANRMYTAAGTPSPDVAKSADGSKFGSKIIESTDWHVVTDPVQKDAMQTAVARDFVVDAWLANWDAPLNDNIRWSEEMQAAIRVDNGGAVMYRARGGVRNLTPDVKELQTMRSASTSPDGARLYSKVTAQDERDGVERILAISPERIKNLAKEEGLPSNVADDLITRRAWLATHYGYALPESTPEGQAFLKAVGSGAAKPDAVDASTPAPVRQLTPNEPASIAPGSPVWIKTKKPIVPSSLDPNSEIVSSSKSVPDVMTITSLYYDGEALTDPVAIADALKQENFDSMVFGVKSPNGKITATVPGKFMEVLRDNNASVSSKYKTGEHVNAGDRVSDKKYGDGTVQEVYPLYAKIALDDGTTRVIRVGNMSKLPDSAVPGPGLAPVAAPPRIAKPDAVFGNPPDWSANPEAVYSRAKHKIGYVIDHDDSNARILFGDGTVDELPKTGLTDPDTVDYDAIEQLKAAKPAAVPRAARPPKAPADKEVKVGGQQVTLKAGDRVLEAQMMYRWSGKRTPDKTWFIVRADGFVEQIGGMISPKNYTKDPATKKVIEPKATTLARILEVAKRQDAVGGGHQYHVRDISPVAFKKWADEIKPDFTIGSSGSRAEFRYTDNDDDSYANLVSMPLSNVDKVLSVQFFNPQTYVTRSKIYMLGIDGKVYKPAPPTDTTVTLRTTKREWVPTSEITAAKFRSDATYDQLGLPSTTDNASVDFMDFNLWRDIVSSSASPLKAVTKGDYLATVGNEPAWWKAGTGGGGASALKSVTTGTVDEFDIRKTQGFDALRVNIRDTLSREKLLEGEFDDVFARGFLGQDGYKVANSGTYSNIAMTKTDGTVITHGDPYMALLGEHAQGHRKSFRLKTKQALNRVKKPVKTQSGADIPVMVRGVAGQAAQQSYFDGKFYQGTGVYGNGTYSSNKKSTARSYGQNLFYYVPKPGAKIAKLDEIMPDYIEDTIETTVQMQSSLSEAIGSPSPQEVSDIGDTLMNVGEAAALTRLEVMVERLADQFSLSDSAINAAKVDAAGTMKKLVADAKANTTIPLSRENMRGIAGAVAYEAYFKSLGFLTKTTQTKLRGNWNPSAPAEWQTKIDVMDQRGIGMAVVTIQDTQTLASSMTSHQVRTAARTSLQSSMDKMPARVDISVPGSNDLIDGLMTTVPIGAYGGSNITGIPDSVEVLRRLLMKNNFAALSSEEMKRAKKLRARQLYISDPGRWALAAGYDGFYLHPGYGDTEWYLIMTNHAAMILAEESP